MDIGIIIITHGKLADALKETLFSIIGEKEKVESISILTEKTLQTLCKEVESTIKKLNTEYVVVFTDMFGGSPCNACLYLCKSFSNMHIISGVNLYMLISSICIREQNKVDNIEEYVKIIIEEAKKSISYVNKLFEKKLQQSF